MTRDRRVAPALALLLLLLAFGAFAEPPPGAGGERPGPPPGRGPRHGPPPIEDVLERHRDRLAIEPAVVEEIRSITEQSRREGEEMRAGLRALHDEMRALLSQDAPDEAQVMRQAERIGALETEAQKHRLRGMLRVRALLTPEQRRELVEIHEEEKAKRRGGGGRHRRGPPPHGPPPHGPPGGPPPY